MEGHRQSVVLATKYTNAFPGTVPNAAGNQRKNMMQAVGASLKRLKTDYIDLYWVHIWDQMTPVEEVMRGLDDLVRAGKVLYTCISDASAWWIAQANTLAHSSVLMHHRIRVTSDVHSIPMHRRMRSNSADW